MIDKYNINGSCVCVSQVVHPHQPLQDTVDVMLILYVVVMTTARLTVNILLPTATFPQINAFVSKARNHPVVIMHKADALPFCSAP